VVVVGDDRARAGDIFVFYKCISIGECISLFVGKELLKFLGAMEGLPGGEDLLLCASAVFVVWVIVEELFEGSVIALWATGKESARVSVKGRPAECVQGRREGSNSCGAEEGGGVVVVVCRVGWGR